MAATLTDIDKNLAEAVVFNFKTNLDETSTIEFQFPPRLTSDGKGADWVEKGQRDGTTIDAYRTAKARSFTIEWTYLCGMGAGWTTDKVKNNVEKIKKYFYREGDDIATEVIILLNFWKFGGEKEQPCRMDTVTISHGQTILVPDGEVALAYPLRTDIKADMKLFTNVEGKIDVEELPRKPFDGWY